MANTKKGYSVLLVELVSGELDLDMQSFGSVTLRREDLQRGFEPDACFYVQSFERVQENSNIDLTVDPPPDLVIEVEQTNPLLSKLPLYAVVGVPEIWRLSEGAKVRILVLAGETYEEAERSIAFPLLSRSDIADLLAQSLRIRRSEWQRAVRSWIQSRLS